MSVQTACSIAAILLSSVATYFNVKTLMLYRKRKAADRRWAGKANL